MPKNRGRPAALVDPEALVRMRTSGCTWPEIGRHFGVHRDTAYNHYRRIQAKKAQVSDVDAGR